MGWTGVERAESYTYPPGVPPAPSSVVVFPVLQRLSRRVADDAIWILLGECESSDHG